MQFSSFPSANMKTFVSHPKAVEIANRKAVKARFEVHLFVQPTPPVPVGMDFARFFQRLKPEDAIARGLPPDFERGILRVAL